MEESKNEPSQPKKKYAPRGENRRKITVRPTEAIADDFDKLRGEKSETVAFEELVKKAKRKP